MTSTVEDSESLPLFSEHPGSSLTWNFTSPQFLTKQLNRFSLANGSGKWSSGDWKTFQRSTLFDRYRHTHECRNKMCKYLAHLSSGLVRKLVLLKAIYATQSLLVKEVVKNTSNFSLPCRLLKFLFIDSWPQTKVENKGFYRVQSTSGWNLMFCGSPWLAFRLLWSVSEPTVWAKQSNGRKWNNQAISAKASFKQLWYLLFLSSAIFGQKFSQHLQTKPKSLVKVNHSNWCFTFLQKKC